jgi:hypothetical protein
MIEKLAFTVVVAGCVISLMNCMLFELRYLTEIAFCMASVALLWLATAAIWGMI